MQCYTLSVHSYVGDRRRQGRVRLGISGPWTSPGWARRRRDHHRRQQPRHRHGRQEGGVRIGFLRTILRPQAAGHPSSAAFFCDWLPRSPSTVLPSRRTPVRSPRDVRNAVNCASGCRSRSGAGGFRDVIGSGARDCRQSAYFWVRLLSNCSLSAEISTLLPKRGGHSSATLIC